MNNKNYENMKAALASPDKLAQQKKQEQEFKKLRREQFEKFIASLQNVADTADGQRVLKELIYHTGVYDAPDCGDNPTKIVEHNARRQVYLRLFRPYLNKKQLNIVERVTDGTE